MRTLDPPWPAARSEKLTETSLVQRLGLEGGISALIKRLSRNLLAADDLMKINSMFLKVLDI